MFYVSSLKGELIGISDTDDGVEEFYTPQQLSDNFSYETIKSIVGVGHRAVECCSGRKVYTDFYNLGEFYIANLKEIIAILSNPCYNEFASILGSNIITNLHLGRNSIETRLGIWFSDNSGRNLLINIKYKDGLYHTVSYEEFEELEIDEDDEEEDIFGEQIFLFTDEIMWLSFGKKRINSTYRSLKYLIDSVEQKFRVELDID